MSISFGTTAAPGIKHKNNIIKILCLCEYETCQMSRIVNILVNPRHIMKIQLDPT